LDRLDPNHTVLDVWEMVLYIMALAFSLEGEGIPLLFER
jgi:hypothetical protein